VTHPAQAKLKAICRLRIAAGFSGFIIETLGPPCFSIQPKRRCASRDERGCAAQGEDELEVG
jgi:hypothetical protein